VNRNRAAAEVDERVGPGQFGQRTHFGAVLLDELRERLGAAQGCLIPRDGQGGRRGDDAHEHDRCDPPFGCDQHSLGFRRGSGVPQYRRPSFHVEARWEMLWVPPGGARETRAADDALRLFENHSQERRWDVSDPADGTGLEQTRLLVSALSEDPEARLRRRAGGRSPPPHHARPGTRLRPLQ
jgi:hypothetical protein